MHIWSLWWLLHTRDGVVSCTIVDHHSVSNAETQGSIVVRWLTRVLKGLFAGDGARCWGRGRRVPMHPRLRRVWLLSLPHHVRSKSNVWLLRCPMLRTTTRGQRNVVIYGGLGLHALFRRATNNLLLR